MPSYEFVGFNFLFYTVQRIVQSSQIGLHTTGCSKDITIKYTWEYDIYKHCECIVANHMPSYELTHSTLSYFGYF